MNVLQFDGAGRVSFADFVTGSGDFRLYFPEVTYKNTTEIFVANWATNLEFIASLGSGNITMRGAGGADITVGGHVDGETIWIELERIGTTLTLATSKGSVSKETTGSLTINAFGDYDSGTAGYAYTGIMGGVVTLTNGTANRSYSMDQALLATVLPDTISSQNGTLTGFVSTTFIIQPTPFMTITSLVLNQFFSADSSGNATVTLAGTISNLGSAPASVEWRKDKGAWAVLDAAPSTSAFSGNIVLNGQGTLEVRLSDDTTVSDSVSNIASVTYEVHVGQSNGAGRGVENQVPLPYGSLIPMMSNTAGDFLVMADPTGMDASAAGSYLPLLANKYAEKSWPIAMTNVCEGGTKIAAWQKGTSLYTRITNAVNASSNGANSIVCNLGESDALDQTLEAAFKTSLNQFVNDCNIDFGIKVYLIGVAQGTTIPLIDGNNVRQWITDVIGTNVNALDGGDLSTIDIDTAPEADNLHLKTNQNLEDAAQIIFDAIAPRATLNISPALGSTTGIAAAASNVEYSVVKASTLEQIGFGIVSWDSSALPSIVQVGAVAGTIYEVHLSDNGTGFKTVATVTAV